MVGSTPVNRSYLALIKADGSYETIRLDGLDNGGVFWTEEGIHFAEEKILVTIDEKEEKEKLVLNFPNYHTPANDLHCRDGKVFALGTLPEENEYGSYQYGDVLTFDLETREFLAVPVTDEEGAPLPLTHEDGTGVAHAQAIDNEAIKDGKLSWYLGNTIYETDVATGVTKELFDISATKKGLSNSQVVFRESDIVVFSYNQDEEIQMIRYNRSTGQELDRVQVDGLAEKTSIEMIPRGFAAKPLS